MCFISCFQEFIFPSLYKIISSRWTGNKNNLFCSLFEKYCPTTHQHVVPWISLLPGPTWPPFQEHISRARTQDLYVHPLVSGQCLQGGVGTLNVQAGKSTRLVKDGAEVGESGWQPQAGAWKIFAPWLHDPTRKSHNSQNSKCKLVFSGRHESVFVEVGGQNILCLMICSFHLSLLIFRYLIHEFAFICILTLGPANAQMGGPRVGKVNLLEKDASESLKFISASLVDTNPVSSIITESQSSKALLI